jgi:MOSC domain-containing protein YiiM
MAKIIAVCISDKKGVSKQNVKKGELKKNHGLVGDAHADGSDRQVSLLDMSSIEKMRKTGIDLKPGDFAENLTTEGIKLYLLPVGTMLNIGDDILLEITQIGKECHTGCAIQKQVGKCIMPQEGVFARVLRGGTVKVGDRIGINGPETEAKESEEGAEGEGGGEGGGGE